MRLLSKWTSTNGRWGVEIVGDLPDGQGWQKLMPGHLVPLGTRGGMQCFCYSPEGEGFIATLGDAVPASGSGAVEVCSMDLQSSSRVTLFHAIAGAIFQVFGYKRRGSDFLAITADGNLKPVPAGVLLALGLIQPSKDEEIAPAPAPEKPSGVMLDALRKAGLI